ncbi:MAG: gamma-glutamyl-gamma-aminobutyrate hydrolase family protein [Geminicoccaceae bacterium]|nr:MAG: gamma-glutamyl-gamma-aminobutyrate hydrolase family protein [Geminicoccaceae bacterium]
MGITTDWQAASAGLSWPRYGCRQNYVDSVDHAGGLAWLLPHQVNRVEDYLAALDGLLVTSGLFDVDPRYYRAVSRHATVTTKERRTAFEIEMITGALLRDLPVLAVGGGHQLLNVVMGGTLIQHIPDEVPEALLHEQEASKTKPSHAVELTQGTLLHRIAAGLTLKVNSDHHQAVGQLGAGLIAAGRASDGVIEAIEAPAHRFVLGVQWAPEFLVSPADEALFAAFVEACRAARPH